MDYVDEEEEIIEDEDKIISDAFINKCNDCTLSAKEFSDWMGATGRTQKEFAAMIGYKVRMVKYYESGEKKIPLTIGIIKKYSQLSEKQFMEITVLKRELEKVKKENKRLKKEMK